MAIATAGVLLEKAAALGDEVHLAMLSRGYRGEVRLLDEFVWHARQRRAGLRARRAGGDPVARR